MDVFEWAAQFDPECKHEERIVKRREKYRGVTEPVSVCTVCDDEQPIGVYFH